MNFWYQSVPSWFGWGTHKGFLKSRKSGGEAWRGRRGEGCTPGRLWGWWGPTAANCSWHQSVRASPCPPHTVHGYVTLHHRHSNLRCTRATDRSREEMSGESWGILALGPNFTWQDRASKTPQFPAFPGAKFTLKFYSSWPLPELQISHVCFPHKLKPHSVSFNRTPFFLNLAGNIGLHPNVRGHLAYHCYEPPALKEVLICNSVPLQMPLV